MTIVSAGYADGSVQDQQWAEMAEALGHVPTVMTNAAWNVTARVGVDREVRVAVGTGFGHGILDAVDAVVDIALPSVTGLPKWATIVAHRNWATPATTFTYVGQSTTEAISASIDAEPGVLADQPIALVRVSAGVQVPDRVVDLRYTLAQAHRGWGEWVDLPHGSNWVDFPSRGHTAAYRLSIPAGRVELRGAIAAADGAISQSTQVGDQLPDTTWPNRPQGFTASAHHKLITNVGASSLPLYGNSVRLAMGVDGRIEFTATYSPQWVSLDGWAYDRT